MIVSLLYRVGRTLLPIPEVVLRRDTAKDAELLVLRDENTVLRRQLRTPVRYEPADSMGLNALLRILRQATSAGGSLVLVSPTDPVKRLLSMCGVDRIISTISASDGSHRPSGGTPAR